MPAPKIAGTIRSKNPLKGAVEILPERLYYAALKQPPPSHNILASTPKRDPTAIKEKKQIHFFQIDHELIYWNFFLDFGPLNLGQLSRFCYKLNDKLRKFPVVCFYSNTLPNKRANAIFLICAWQILFLKRSTQQAYAGFMNHPHDDLPSAYPSGRRCNSMSLSDETEIDDDDDDDDDDDNNKKDASSLLQQQQQESNGDGDDMQLSPKQLAHSEANAAALIMAASTSSLPPISQSQGAITVEPLPPFHDASPVPCTYDLSVVDCLDGMVKALQLGFWSLDDFDVDEYEHFEQVENGDLNWLVQGHILAFAGPSYERHVSPEGYCTLSPNDYIPYFQKKKVDLVVRLNKKNYHERDFVKAGIRHVEHFYVDGSCPSMKILNAVLQDFESVPEGKAFAVHCKAGLGRTGTCVGAYLMKHYKFTAAEVIGWMRICRPGCVIGPQQQFLQSIQQRMWQAGDSKVVPRNRLNFFKSNRGSKNNNNKKKAEGDDEDKMNQVTTSLSSSSPDRVTPESPRARLTKDAVEGRAGQGDALLAARGRNKQQQQQQQQSIKTAIPTPPITPEPKEKIAVVTPDASNSIEESNDNNDDVAAVTNADAENSDGGDCAEGTFNCGANCGTNGGIWLS